MDDAAPQTFQPVDLGSHALDLALAGLRIAEQDLACRGQFDAARMALEKRRAQFVLELLDLATERGLGNMQFLCRFSNRAAARDRREIAQADMHHLQMPPPSD